VERGPAERADGQRVVDALLHGVAIDVEEFRAVEGLAGRLTESLVARLLDALGDAVHGPVERLALVPVGGAGRPIPDLGDAVGIDDKLERGRPLGAERPGVDRAVGVALDIDDLAAALVDADQLAAADGAVGADAGHFAGVAELEAARLGPGGAQVEAEAEQAAQGEAPADRGAKELTPVESVPRG